MKREMRILCTSREAMGGSVMRPASWMIKAQLEYMLFLCLSNSVNSIPPKRRHPLQLPNSSE
jgi:hypothetical protein